MKDHGNLPAGHQGDHANAFGDRWPSAARVRSTEDAALERELEFRCVSRKLEALYARQMAGEDSTLIRQRVKRLEALTAALCGSPEQLSS
jgi:hypothetical protein